MHKNIKLQRSSRKLTFRPLRDNTSCFGGF